MDRLNLAVAERMGGSRDRATRPYRDQFIPPDRGLPSIAAAPDPGQARARPTFGREVPDTDHSRHLDAARLADVARASHRCFRNQVLVAAT